MKRRTLLLKVPKDAVNSRKKRRAVNEMHCDYLKRQQRPANRRRTDPVVVLSTILESILNEMRDLPDVQPFLFPVNAKVRSNFVSISSKLSENIIIIGYITAVSSDTVRAGRSKDKVIWEIRMKMGE